MNSMAIIAGKEFRDDFRSRWTIAVAVLFTVLALSISYFGGAAAGKVGFTSFDATLASLTTLAAFVVPLIGLLLAHDMVVGEQDNGTLLLVLSYPISRAELVAGKFVGHCAALATATLVGFGVAVAIIQIMQPEARSVAAWLSIGNFVLSASMLGASFVALASVISVTTADKARAAGLALVTWLLTVIIFDLCLLAVLVLSGGSTWEQSVFPRLLYLNPIDIFRLINLTTLGSGSGNELFMGMTATHVYPLWVLYLALLLWVVTPFALAQFLFRRKEV
ncbi:ABC transporter permease subunit [Rhodanobacter sp. AS-Z3]|uniref:ABC transporter permease n=1 Tax=Rhodanobacter sp. AS-Z3 TaxID=3031330 RepID=UPI00247A3FDE|nr:ABC transporter permease subunit [Rhodanobacter sp. AS-Z3]WEN14520.1 ABC transporter permease subunit [Rhodanobacter sp. AS-Z3]